MRIIFLDVDGVLNYQGARSKLPQGTYFVDDDRLEVLKEMVEKTEAQLVLSSSWRRGWGTQIGHREHNRYEIDESKDYFMLCAKLHDYGLSLLSEIPILTNGNREDAIDYWLSAWPGEKVDDYVILDDEPHKFQPNNPHLIVTSIETGLQRKHIKDALKILNMKESKKELLIVDDIETNRAVLQAILESDYEIYEANNGKRALEILELHPEIDAVLTDIQMPEMNGLELIQTIRANDKYKNMIIVANTQYGDAAQEEMILDMGADDFLYKPSTPKIIKRRISNNLLARDTTPQNK